MPEKDNRRLYEGLFLLNPSKINSSVSAATKIVRQLLDRADAEVLAIYRWDERRLAYEIDGQKRGLYMLTYFRADGRRLAGIERDVNLSEQVMRCMMVRADHVGETELQLAIDKQSESQTAEALEQAGEGEGQTGGEQAAGAEQTAAAGPGSESERSTS